MKKVISTKLEESERVYLKSLLMKSEVDNNNKFLNSLIKVIKSDPGVEALLIKRIIKFNQHVDKETVDEK